MSTEVKNSIGTKIKIGATYVARLTKIGVPKLTKEKIDVTTLDSEDGYREYIGGFRDSGELDVEGFAISDSGQTSLKSNYDNDENESFTIETPNGRTCTFMGYVSEYEEGEAVVNEPVKFKAKITVSGPVDYAETASTGASALVITQAGGTALTGGAWTPTFANGTRKYAFTFNTQTAFVVKVTAASHTLKLYVDDNFVENLTSATESSAIALASAGAKKVVIKAYESGKTPVFYEIMVGKTA